MTDLPHLGKALIIIGAIVAAIGLLMILSGKVPWIGRLPGDFHYRGENFSFYFPLATSLVISIVLTLIFWIINRR